MDETFASSRIPSNDIDKPAVLPGADHLLHMGGQFNCPVYSASCTPSETSFKTACSQHEEVTRNVGGTINRGSSATTLSHMTFVSKPPDERRCRDDFKDAPGISRRQDSSSHTKYVSEHLRPQNITNRSKSHPSPRLHGHHTCMQLVQANSLKIYPGP